MCRVIYVFVYVCMHRYMHTCTYEIFICMRVIYVPVYVRMIPHLFAVKIYYCSPAIYAVYRICSIPYMLYTVYVVYRICCKPYMLYAVYAVYRICCIPYMLYTVYAVYRICCIPYMLYTVYTVIMTPHPPVPPSTRAPIHPYPHPLVPYPPVPPSTRALSTRASHPPLATREWLSSSWRQDSMATHYYIISCYCCKYEIRNIF